jgi:hypothetical protein
VEGKEMHINSKFVKRAAGTLVLTLSVLSAVFGLTACGTHGGGGGFRGGGFHGGSGQSFSAPLDSGHIVK